MLINEIAANTPEVPHSYDPQYPIWKREFERFEVTPETILVGHSCGGGFLVRWLSENKEARAKKVVLVAPWLDLERESTTDFFDFQIDFELSSRIGELIIFCSDDDNISIQESVKKIRDEIAGITYREFHGYGHFTQSTMKKPEFPELLAVLLS